MFLHIKQAFFFFPDTILYKLRKLFTIHGDQRRRIRMFCNTEFQISGLNKCSWRIVPEESVRNGCCLRKTPDMGERFIGERYSLPPILSIFFPLSYIFSLPFTLSLHLKLFQLFHFYSFRFRLKLKIYQLSEFQNLFYYFISLVSQSYFIISGFFHYMICHHM